MSRKKIFLGLLLVSVAMIGILFVLSSNQTAFAWDPEENRGFYGDVTYDNQTCQCACWFHDQDVVQLLSYPGKTLLRYTYVEPGPDSAHGYYGGLVPPDPGVASYYYILGLGFACGSQYYLVHWEACPPPNVCRIQQNVVMDIESGIEGPGGP